MHHLHFIETPWEKAKLEQRKDAMFSFQLILEGTLNKTAAVWPVTSHVTNHPSKTSQICWIRIWYQPVFINVRPLDSLHLDGTPDRVVQIIQIRGNRISEILCWDNIGKILQQQFQGYIDHVVGKRKPHLMILSPKYLRMKSSTLNFSAKTVITLLELLMLALIWMDCIGRSYYVWLLRADLLETDNTFLDLNLGIFNMLAISVDGYDNERGLHFCRFGSYHVNTDDTSERRNLGCEKKNLCNPAIDHLLAAY